MAFDRAELRASLEQRRISKLKDQRANLTAAAMAVAPMEVLIGDPKWDGLIQTAQAENDVDSAALAAVIRQLHDDRTVSHDAMMLLKISIARIEGRIEGRRRVMEIPKEMIEGGKQAVEALKELRDA